MIKKILIWSLVLVALFGAWALVTYLQRVIRPRESFKRLLLYIISCLLAVMLISFAMVFAIGKIFPGELIK